MNHNEECLICKAPLEYLQISEPMECALCHKVEQSKTRCVNGHYVCNDCHLHGIDALIGLCLQQTSTDPYLIFRRLVDIPSCHMHGPEHHVFVGAALLTAYHNAGGTVALEKALSEMLSRGRQVPGGICGFWGSCGAAVSAGIFISIVTGATPLSTNEWGLANQMTGLALQKIGEIGGPRCCKRNGALAITEAVSFVQKHLGITMTLPEIRCEHSAQNNQCLKESCPFHK